MSAPRTEGTGIRRTLRIARGAALAMSAFVALGAAGCLMAAWPSPIALVEPERFVHLSRNAGELFRLSVVLGVCGGSLAFGILVLAVRGLFWRSGPARMDRLMIVGLVAVVAFGVGGLALAGFGPSLIRSYVEARDEATRQTVIQNVSQVFWIAQGVLWQIIGVSAAGLWWFLLARLLPPGERVTRSVGFGLAGCAAVIVITRVAGIAEIPSLAVVFAMALVVLAGMALRGTFRRIGEALDDVSYSEDEEEDEDDAT